MFSIMCSWSLLILWDFSFVYLIRCFVCINSCNCVFLRICFDFYYIDYNLMIIIFFWMEFKVGSIRFWFEIIWNFILSWVFVLVCIIMVRCSVGWIYCGLNGINSDSLVLNLDFCLYFRFDWVEIIWWFENCRC